MRIASSPRAQLGLAAVLSVAITGALLAQTSSVAVPEVATAPAPEFLAWSGSPFDDGLNHYLVTIEPARHDHWLILDADDQLVAVDNTGQGEVEVGELETAVSGSRQRLDQDESLAAIRHHAGIDSVRSIGFGAYAVAGTIDAAALAQVPGVHQVTADVALAAASVDPYFPSQWALENDGDSPNEWTMANDADIDAPEAWHRTRGRGVVVAVVDSGVDVAHPDLAANVWNNPDELCGNGIDDDGNGFVDDCEGWDFANNDNTVEDLVGHGTHVAGIIGAEADNAIGVAGVAYEAEVMALKIGDGAPALSAALEAFDYAIANGARIINASWLLDDPAAAPYLDLALAGAEEAGVLVVTGAGNEPIDLDTSPVYPASSPRSNVIAVAASTAADQPAAFSGYGDGTVDLYAPGEHIVSTVPGGYGVYSGTSMAAPMVAGAAALLWAATPAASFAEIKGALLDRSDGPNDGVTSFRNLAVSDGRLNVERSIYTRLFQPPVMYTFHDFNSFPPDQGHDVSIVAKTVDPWRVPPQTPVMYRAGLYVPHEGEAMAVVGHDITHTDDTGSTIATTDTTGRALVGDIFESEERTVLVQDGDVTRLSMTLPAGTYAFVMEIVDVTDPAEPVTMGDPSAVFFIVEDDGNVMEMPEISIGGEPPPTTTPISSTTSVPAPTSTTQPTSTTSGVTSSTLPPVTTTTAPPTTTAAPTETTAPPVPTTTVPPATTTTQPGPTTTVAVTTTTTAPVATTTTAPAIPATSTTSTTTTTIPEEGIQVTDIDPGEGPTTGGILVTLTGRNIPEFVDVFFGDRRAEIVSVMAPTFIVVDLPPGEAGPVDVTVVDRVTGAETVFPSGFTYRDPSGVTTTTTTTTTTTAPPVPGPTTTTVPVTTTSAAPPSTTATTAAPPPVPEPTLDDWLDSVLRTPEGLTLAPPADDDPMAHVAVELWAGAICDEPVCPGWVLET